MSYTLYWMQAALRCRFNPALEKAAAHARQSNTPLAVLFFLQRQYPRSGPRSFAFLKEGLEEAANDLQARGIAFYICEEPPESALPRISGGGPVFTETTVLPAGRQMRRKVKAAGVTLVETEANLVVPPAAVSQKEEYSAATLRRRITPLIPHYLTLEDEVRGFPPWNKGAEAALTAGLSPVVLLSGFPGDFPEASASPVFRGGTRRAEDRLEGFLAACLDGPRRHYSTDARDPAAEATSTLSPYLHFGMISPRYIALRVRQKAREGAGETGREAEAFLEQLIVRRELAANFTLYNPDVFQYESAVPSWARQTLALHAADPRPYLYSREELEQAATHDPAWNAAQQQMRETGFMHNYMRMYWGKKVMEWSPSPREAFERLHYLNDTYLLDGRDFNGWTGIAWCFGRHDRPWGERAVFGKTRYMNYQGLKRKFKIDEYIRRWIPQ